jgi:hypothetical protein
MRIDLYTKAMLTMIAGCLLWLCLDAPSVLTPMHAQNSNASRVLVAGWVDQGGTVRLFPSPTASNALPVIQR